jgi:hypothetical protein
VKLVGRVDVIGKSEDGVFECEQGPGVYVEFDVEINRSAAPVFGMQINFPGLTQRIRLDEMSFIVHVETVSDRMIL